MGYFPCFVSKNDVNAVNNDSTKDFGKDGSTGSRITRVSSDKSKSKYGSDSKKEASVPKDGQSGHIAARSFTFWKLAATTKNFRT